MTKDKSDGEVLLEGAYDLETPEDSVNFYRDFSSTYDTDFAEALGFTLPNRVAHTYLRARNPNDTPIADLGCGTGLVADALRDTDVVIDGLDISLEMLEKADKKNTYRNLLQIDLTKSVAGHENVYKAVLSSGTFTHGHLGPEAIDMAMRLGQSGCLFVLSINLAHYGTLGFGAKFISLSEIGTIYDFHTEEVAIYNNPDHDHSTDRALIVSFRKA